MLPFSIHSYIIFRQKLQLVYFCFLFIDHYCNHSHIHSDFNLNCWHMQKTYLVLLDSIYQNFVARAMYLKWKLADVRTSMLRTGYVICVVTEILKMSTISYSFVIFSKTFVINIFQTITRCIPVPLNLSL